MGAARLANRSRRTDPLGLFSELVTGVRGLRSPTLPSGAFQAHSSSFPPLSPGPSPLCFLLFPSPPLSHSLRLWRWEICPVTELDLGLKNRSCGDIPRLSMSLMAPFYLYLCPPFSSSSIYSIFCSFFSSPTSSFSSVVPEVHYWAVSMRFTFSASLRQFSLPPVSSKAYLIHGLFFRFGMRLSPPSPVLASFYFTLAAQR